MSMDEKGRVALHQYTIRHLENISASSYTTCPSIARFYLLKLKAKEENRNGYQKHDSHQFSRCPFCYAPYLPDSVKVRLLPKMKLTAKVKRLLKRHAENPESLGKFQQKLVNDYIHGRNRLAIQCLQCKKTVKIPGQSRQDRFRQTQHQTEDTESVISDIPKTRKEKVKEKKKRNKRRKKEKMGVDDDPNAGLIINTSTPVTDLDTNQSAPIQRNDKDLSQISTSQKPEEDSPRNEKVSSNQNHSNKSIQNQLFKDKTTVEKDPSIGQQPHNVKPSVAGWLMSSKKKKGKRLSQQLGDILKQEKSKAAEGNLADFLSSI